MPGIIPLSVGETIVQATSILQAALSLVAIYRQFRAQIAQHDPAAASELPTDAAVIALFRQDAAAARLHLEVLIARHRSTS